MNSLKKHIPLITLCLGFFMVIMDTSVVNVALPSIAADLQSNITGLQWVVVGYTLTFSCFLLLSGYLADHFGAKKTLLIGLTLFLIASLGCGLSSSLPSLILFRLFQGLSAASLAPSSLVLINHLYTHSADKAKAIGIWGCMGGIAAASGPVVSGVLTSSLGWPSIFFINIPIAFIAIILTIFYIQETVEKNKIPFDYSGQILSFIMIASLALSLIHIDFFSTLINTHYVIGSICFITVIAFIITEKKVKHPMIPLTFFQSTNFSISIISGMIINIGIYGVLFILPLYFQQIRGYSAFKTGFAILPFVGLVAVSSYFSGKLTSLTSPKLPMFIGFFTGMLGFFSLLIIKDNSPDYIYLILPLGAIGFGVAFTMPAATLIAIHSVPKENGGIASGIFTTSRQLGSLIGVAVFGTILAKMNSFVIGFHVALILAGLLFFVGFMLCFLICDKKIIEKIV